MQVRHACSMGEKARSALILAVMLRFQLPATAGAVIYVLVALFAAV